jgi:hypothetical protein
LAATISAGVSLSFPSWVMLLSASKAATNGTRRISAPRGCMAARRQDGDTRMSYIVHNEKLKLRATFLNNLGIAAFIACFITPRFFEFVDTRIERLIMAIIGLIVCGLFHALATSRLSGLRE